MESPKREDAATTTRENHGIKAGEMKNKSMWNNEAVKAYESGQGVMMVKEPHPHGLKLMMMIGLKHLNYATLIK